MAEFAVSFAAQTIETLLIDEAKLLWGVGGKVKDLQEELKLIQKLLINMDDRRQYDREVEELIVELRETAYKAEDVIEQYILRIMLKEDENIIKACAHFLSNCTCARVHSVGTEIESLKSKIFYVRKRMEEHGIKSVKASMPTRTYAHVEEDFVGRKDSIKELVEELLKGGKQHRVISIWGMDGLGKTALAKKILAHEEVKKHFDDFAWACVSRECDVKDILEAILVKLIPDRKKEVKEMREEELSRTIYNTLRRKKCIVVLDDIWNKQAWKSLKHAFPTNNTGSKLVITTRNKEVAVDIDPLGFLHQPQRLSEEESWELLKMRAFPEAEKITENMKKLGGEFLRKCAGLPSAVIVLGGILAVKKKETNDRNINSQFSNKILEVLAINYDDLPWNLKQCFLYLCSFPTDEIPAAKVSLMWIAEGFVSVGKREFTVEDVAEQHLMELANRGLVQVRFTLSGKIKTCRLYDPMRDLCVYKAMQEKFLIILNSHQAEEVDSICGTRRLSVHMSESAEQNTIPKVNQIESICNLRTLMFFHSEGPIKVSWEHLQPILINCKFLRVLKLEDLDIEGNLPKSVGDLIHLRYLSLKGSKFEGLPQSLGNLVCMESLDLCTIPYYRLPVPNVLWKMRKLRHLHLPFTFDIIEKLYENRKKLRLDTLKNLLTLRNFCPENCDVNDVGKLTNLRKLNVTPGQGSDKLEVIPRLAKFISKHLCSSSFGFQGSFTEDELRKMSCFHRPCKLSILGEIKKLPEHENLPQRLRKLVLMDSKLEEDPMLILEKLQELVFLVLGNLAFLGKEMVCTAKGFPHLKHLVLDNLPNLVEWRAGEGAMPNLSRIGISNCPKLKTVPQGVNSYDGSDDIDHEVSKIATKGDTFLGCENENEEQWKSTRLHTS